MTVLHGILKKTNTKITCGVTYVNQGPSYSGPHFSEFDVTVKALNFGSITYVGNSNFGCTNSVDFSLNTYSCGNYCNYTYTVGATEYDITWISPTGWTQTSISPQGNNVTFTPDQTTGGQVKAIITLDCGFIDERVFNFGRTAPAPTFANPDPAPICGSSTTIAINGQCGVTDYTYTLSGGSGATFTAMGFKA